MNIKTKMSSRGSNLEYTSDVLTVHHSCNIWHSGALYFNSGHVVISVILLSIICEATLTLKESDSTAGRIASRC